MTAPRVAVLREFAEGHSFLLARPSTPRKLAPILYVHGMGLDAGYLVRLMEHCTQKTGRFGYAVDIVEHGRHAHHEDRSVSLEHYVADIAHFLRKVVIKKHGMTPILIGHSMGGLITLALSARGYAERVVLITPAPPKGITYRFGRLPIPTIGDVQGFTRMCVTGRPFRVSRQILAQIFADPIADQRLINELSEEFEFRESLTVLRELRASSYAVDPRAIKVPLLVIGAGKDVLVHPDTFKEIKNQYRGDYKLFPDLGHFCPFETGWENVALYILDWLKQKKTWRPRR